jgi:hypothetical protein
MAELAELYEYENVLTHKSDYGYDQQKRMGPMTHEEHFTRKRWCNLSHPSGPSSPLPTEPPSLN